MRRFPSCWSRGRSGTAAISTDGGTIDIQASSSLTMAAGSTIVTDGATTTGGNVRLSSGAAMALTGINAGTASVSLLAGAAITDAGDTVTDVLASQLRVSSGAGVGEAAGSNFGLLDLSVGTLSLRAAGAVYLSEATDITVGSTAAVAYNRVGSTGAVTAQTADATQEDLLITGTDSHLVFTTVAGTLTVGGTDAAGISR